jgi:phospholipase C
MAAVCAAPLVLCALALAACASPGTTAGPTPSESSPPPRAPEHIVVIMEENKPSDTVLNGDEAPFLNSLASTYAVATEYTAITNPSLPNYIALTSGTTADISTDCLPAECGSLDAPSIADRVESSGRDWRIYGEGMPAPCSTSNSGRYAVKHIPFVYFRNVVGDPSSCARHVVPYTQLAGDLADGTLPDLVFLTPDLCNDMHDCAIATGDAWLSREVPQILQSAWFGKDSLLVITFDEGTWQDNQVTTVFAGPAAKPGASSSIAYSHYALLHTIEALWGLEPLTENDRDAPVMQDLLRDGG